MTAHELAKKLLDGPDLEVVSLFDQFQHFYEYRPVTDAEVVVFLDTKDGWVTKSEPAKTQYPHSREFEAIRLD